MPHNGPAIPAAIERAVLLEAGGRCAVPRCEHLRVQIAHIVPWEKVQSHEFSNLIALCPNCHDAYDNGVGNIDRKAMRQIKANLATLNARYGEFERRVLDRFAIMLHGYRSMDEAMQTVFGDLRGAELIEAQMAEARRQMPGVSNEEIREKFGLLFATSAAMRSHVRPEPHVDIPQGMELLVWYLVRDGYLVEQQQPWIGAIKMDETMLYRRFVLTEAGRAFVDGWVSAGTIADVGR